MKKKTSRTTRSKPARRHGHADNDTNTRRVIADCRELRQAIAEGRNEFQLLLMGGACFSRKHITTDDRGRFRVFNYISESVRRLTGKELFAKSEIGDAMRKGAFIAEGIDHA